MISSTGPALIHKSTQPLETPRGSIIHTGLHPKTTAQGDHHKSASRRRFSPTPGQIQKPQVFQELRDLALKLLILLIIPDEKL